MGFVRKNIYLILIFTLAIILRFNYDLLIKGFNFDEIAIVSVAKQAFPFEIIKTMATIDYHAPLYYFVTHPFTYLEHSWHYLRFLNLLFSLLNIYVFYKIGTLLKDKKLGYFLALFLTVSHIEITTVSFVKFYCLCFLLFSTSIYYFIKIIKKDIGYRKLATINIFFILSSTLGFFVVFLQYLILFILKRNKKVIKSGLLASIGFFLYFPILLQQFLLNKETVISPHASYSEFSTIAFYNFLNDYLSPLLNYSCNSTPIEACTYLLNFIKSIKFPPFDFHSFFVFIFLSLIPVSIGVYGIINSFKNKKIRSVNYLNFSYIFIFAILTKLEMTGFIPLYIYPSGIILIISALYGITLIKSKKLSTFLLSYLVFIQFIIPNYYPKEKRTPDYIKEYYCIEKFIKNYKENHLIFITGGRFLKKYYSDYKITDFDIEKMEGSHRKEYIGYLFGQDVKKKANKYNMKDLIQDNILNNTKNKAFEDFFKKTIVNKTEKKEKITLVFYSREIPFIFNDEIIKELLLDYKYFPHLSKMRLQNAFFEPKEMNAGCLSNVILSHSVNYLADLLDENFKRIKIEQYQRTPNDDYVKVFETDSFDESTKWIAQNAIKSWIFITFEKSN